MPVNLLVSKVSVIRHVLYWGSHHPKFIIGIVVLGMFLAFFDAFNLIFCCPHWSQPDWYAHPHFHILFNGTLLSCLFQKREVTPKGICYSYLVIPVIKYTFIIFMVSPWDKSRLQNSFSLRLLTGFWEKTSLFHWLLVLQDYMSCPGWTDSHYPPEVYTD